jgi:uncharacterized protein YndB with AHSA1/START domain
MDKVGDSFVNRQVRIEARPETVFRFFVDPDRIVQWMGVRAELDPRPGGVYRVEVTPRSVAEGRFVEVSPYSRIVFTWGWVGDNVPVPPGSTTVEVTFVPDGAGTIVQLRHSGLPEAEAHSHAEGWDYLLARLVEVGEGRSLGPDPMAA